MKESACWINSSVLPLHRFIHQVAPTREKVTRTSQASRNSEGRVRKGVCHRDGRFVPAMCQVVVRTRQDPRHTCRVDGGSFNAWIERMRGETRTAWFAYAAGLGEQNVTAAR